MKKGTKSFGGFIVVTLSAILIIAAIVAAAFYNEVVIPEPETQAIAAGEEYVHGSDIGRRPSGTAGTDYYNVSTYSDFRTRVNNNQNINLTSNITFENGSLKSTASYTGTIYGNGHTITFDFSAFSSATNDQGTTYAGFLAGQLDGNIYDLKIVITGGTFKSGYHGIENSQAAFGLVGYARAGSVIDNINITVNTGSGVIAYTTDNSNHIAFGLVAGMAQDCTINNITVTNNGFIAAGYSDNSNGTGDISYRDWQGTFDEHRKVRSASHIVGGYNFGTVSLNNIIIYGSGEVRGRESTNLGTTWSQNSIVNVSNFLNHFTGQFRLPRELDNDSGANPGTSASGFAKNEAAAATSINTYFEYYDNDSATVSAKGAYNATISEKLSFRTTGVYANMQILFDPSASNYNNSLVVLYTNQTTPDGVIRLWSLGSNDNGRTFSGTEENGTVIFADLPVQSIWNNNDWGTGTYPRGDGYFEAHLSHTVLTKAADLTEYDHGYVEGHNSSTTGTALNNTNFESALNSSENSDSGVTKTYYLTSDILVSGFTSRTLSSVNLDGNGYTIYITGSDSSLGGTDIGGLAGLLNNSTIKNLRIVVTKSMTITATNAESSKYSGSKTLGIGILAGRITGNALVENVQVYIPEGITVTGTANNTDCSLGGLAGNMSGRGRVSNCTVQLDGTLYCRRSYPFVAGFVGNTEDPNFTSDGTDNIAFNYNNIIFKGAGYLSGQHTNTHGTEKLYVAAITITDQIGSYNGKWIDIDGFIYAFNDNPIPTTTEYSMYGFVTQNHNGDSSLTNASDSKPMGSYITASNIFTATRYTAVKNGNDKGNTYWNIPTNATISGSVTNLGGSTVTPYFRPRSTDNITLVASASNWSGFELLKADGASTALSVDSGSDKVIDVAKNNAASEGAITVVKFETVEFGTDGALNSLTYTGEGQDATANLVYQGSTYGGAYSLSYTANGGGASLSNEKPLTVGNYLVTITLTGNEFFYYNGAASKTYTGLGLRMDKALVPFGVSLGNDSLTYTASELTGDPSVIATSGGDKYDHLLDDLGTVTFTYTPSGESSPLSGATNAGTYTVSFTYTNTANVGILNDAITTATLTIKPKQVTLGANSVEKTFASDSGAITSDNVDDNATYGLTINEFIVGDTNAAYTVSLASPEYIEENGTGTQYLVEGGYNLTVTLSSSNYTFGTNSNTVSVTVLKNAGANRFTTEYQRAGWTYYSDPTELSAPPVARFGTVNAIVYTDSEGEMIDPFSKTTPVGTYTATVTVDGNDSYDALSSKYTFDISQLTVSITGISSETVDYTTAAYAGNITITIDGYSAEDVAAILGEITYKHRLASATETEYTSGLPTNAGAYTLGIESVGNVTAGNISVSGLDTVTADLVINKKTVAFNAVTPGGTNLAYGSAADPMSVVTVSPVIPEGFESDFTVDDWSWKAVFEEGYEASTEVDTSVTLTVSVTIKDDNYTAQLDQSEFEFTVVQATLTLTVEGFGTLENGVPGWIYDGTAHKLTVSVPDDLGAEVVLTYYTVSDGSYTAIEGNIAPTDAGNYAVTASISGDTNYADVTSEYFEYTIQKAQMVIEVTMNGWIYNGNAGTAAVVSGQWPMSTTHRMSRQMPALIEWWYPFKIPRITSEFPKPSCRSPLKGQP